jgi:pimeloyl-ACP methyl ester carboxylesterase
VTADAAEVLIDGPWRHRFVAANGGRFHVAEAGDGDGPLVLLLHGFPQFWWVWRHQLPALAAAGYHAVAMDLRGYGGSDKPPRGYDTPTLTEDVAGVVRALGAAGAVIVGHDWGAWIAWSMPALQPRVTEAVAVLSMGHPLTMRHSVAGGHQLRATGRLLEFQLPIAPERSLAQGSGVADVLTSWSADGSMDDETVSRYARAMQLPFVAHTSMEYYRWVVRSVLRRDGRRFAAAVRRPLDVPVLQLHGELDPWVLPETAAASRRWVTGPMTYRVLPDAGHFLPDEAPGEVTAALLSWLTTLELVSRTSPQRAR